MNEKIRVPSTVSMNESISVPGLFLSIKQYACQDGLCEASNPFAWIFSKNDETRVPGGFYD